MNAWLLDQGAQPIFWIWAAWGIGGAWVLIRYGGFVHRCRVRLRLHSIEFENRTAQSTEREGDVLPAPAQDRINVVIPCRNEARTLPFLLADLQAQTVPVRVWVVDDGSDDLTQEVAKKWGVHVLQNQGHGKKMALITAHSAIQASEPSGWMATLDADVSLDKDWAVNLLHEAKRTGADALVGGVWMEGSPRDAFDRFQTQEYACMMSWIKGGVLNESLAMGSGANLLFRTEFYPADRLHREHASGDDAYALMAIKDQGRRIAWSQPIATMVRTRPATAWSGLWNQRARWASKTIAQDLETKRVAQLIASVQVFYASAWILAILMILFHEWALAGSGLLAAYIGVALAHAHLIRTAQKHFPLEVHRTDLWMFPMRYSRLVWGSWWYLLRGKVEWKGRRL